NDDDQSNNINCGTSISFGTFDNTSTTEDVTYYGQVNNGSTPGTIQYQFAQVTSGSSTSTTVRGNSSFIIAYKVSGADYAETYYTKDNTIHPGDVVAIDPSVHAGVKKATTAYQSNALGIISTLPGEIIGDAPQDANVRPVPLALAGRVPV